MVECVVSETTKVHIEVDLRLSNFFWHVLAQKPEDVQTILFLIIMIIIITKRLNLNFRYGQHNCKSF